MKSKTINSAEKKKLEATSQSQKPQLLVNDRPVDTINEVLNDLEERKSEKCSEISLPSL